MKIKLILCANPDDALRKKDPMTPLSLALLAGSAPDNDYEFIDLLWESEHDINYDEPVDAVGISVRMTAEGFAYKIADEFRKRKIPVIIGGPQASSVPHRALKHADAVAVGEGEELWPVILSDLKGGYLKDFYVCSSNNFDAKGKNYYKIDFTNLKNIPKPNRKLFKRNYTFNTLFASRGCPIGCEFCSVPGIFGKKYRFRPIADVIDEIKSFKGYYYLLDDAVFGRPSTYDYYLDLYREISKLKKKHYWTGQVNLDAASDEKGREVIKTAKEAGFLYAAVGMESINPVILKKTGVIAKMGVRSSSDVIEKMKENITFLQNQGIIVSGWFTFGYDEDTIDTIYDIYEFCRETHVLPVISPVNALPNTPLYERLEKSGRLDNKHHLTNYPHLSVPSDKVIEGLKYVVYEGYSFKENWRRLKFYLKKFKKDKIHKTIFLMILQSRMRTILSCENRNLESPFSQNYTED